MPLYDKVAIGGSAFGLVIDLSGDGGVKIIPKRCNEIVRVATCGYVYI